MGRVAHPFSTKIILVIVAVLALGGSGAVLWHENSSPAHVQTLSSSSHHITQLSYKGQTGVDALTLLKAHASVQTKHYSFGDLVTAIDGTVGNGPKYWTFYVNNKEATVGAGAYITKSTDSISWKLQ